MVFRVSQGVNRLQEMIDQERYQKFVAEKQLKESILNERFLKSELSKAQGKLRDIQSILEEGKRVRTDLKTQVKTLAEAKETLQQKIEKIKSVPDKEVPDTGEAP